MRVDQSSCRWTQIVHSKLLLHCDYGSLTARTKTKGPPVGRRRKVQRRGSGRLADQRADGGRRPFTIRVVAK